MALHVRVEMGVKERERPWRWSGESGRRGGNEPKGLNGMAGSGEDKKRGKKGDKVLREIRQKARNLSPATETRGQSRVRAWTERRSESSGRLSVAELTYIDLTENNVYYAANHNQGVEHIPGIPKIALSEVERAAGESDVRSAQTRSLYSYSEF